MKALTCPSCHAPASPNTNDKIIKCEYCGVSFVNEFFSEEEAGCPEEDEVYFVCATGRKGGCDR